MNRDTDMKNKKIILITISIIIAVAAIITGVLFGVFRDEKKQPEPKRILVKICYEDKKDYVIYDSVSNPEVKISPISYEVLKGGSLYIENTLEAEKNDILNIKAYIEKNNQTLTEISLDLVNAETHSIKTLLNNIDEGNYNMYLTFEKADSTEYYVNSEESFKQAIKKIDEESFEETKFDEAKSEEVKYDEEKLEQIKFKNNIINMLADIKLSATENKYFIISSPFVWNTNGHKFITENNILFKEVQESIDDETESNDKAPEDTVSEKSDVVKTMTINNLTSEDISAGKIFCNTPNWNYVINKTFGNFAEEKYFYINAAKVNDKTVDNSKIYIDTQEKLDLVLRDKKFNISDETKIVSLSGDIHIQTKSDVVINEPDLEILWEGTYAFNETDAQKYLNVKSYNGTVQSAYIGGLGESYFTEGTISGLELEKNGNFLTVNTGYADQFNIKKAKVKATLSNGGTGELKKDEAGNYYYIVTDEKGKTYGYKVNVESKRYNLPVIYITTEGGKKIDSKEEYVPGNFTIDYNGYAGSGGFSTVENSAMEIRGRGNSTWILDKKPYKVKFESKTSLFGLKKSKEWVLLANHVDCSLMRNTVTMSMASALDNMLFVPHSYLVDVFVNGQYVGVYSLSEQIEIKGGRIEGEKDSTEIDTDYLLEWGGNKKTTSFGTNVFATYINGYVTVEEPDEKVLTYEQYKYIKNYLMETDEAIRAGNYEEYIDVDSFVDFFILNELSYNADGTMRRSNFILKKKGGKLYYAAPWDYDYAYENLYVGKYYKKWLCEGTPTTDAYKEGKYIKENWLSLLLQDEKFKAKVKARWNEVKGEIYDNAMTSIETNREAVAPSAAENFQKWEILGKKIGAQNRDIAEKLDTYDKHVNFLKEFIINRYNWMDKEISKW